MSLPPSYLQYLRSLPHYIKPIAGEEPWGMFIFTYLWRPFLKKVVQLTLVNVDADGNCPRWVGIVIVALYQALWWYHDVLHRRVFCEGDGGKMEFRRVSIEPQGMGKWRENGRGSDF
jgi:hypothetical protein